MKLNVFYIATFVSGLVLLYSLDINQSSAPLSFYGFAESSETKINYNYAVVVAEILVSPGQEVLKGDTLMFLQRRKSKESIDDYQYKIDQLKSQSDLWVVKKENTLSLLKQEKNRKLHELTQKINQLERELAYKLSLSENLENIDKSSVTYSPIKEKINQLKDEYQQSLRASDLQINAEKRELKIGINPFKQEIIQIQKESIFSKSQKVITIALVAPEDGLIGNISCKKEEHIQPYSTLLTFYEPHSRYVRGYVHEDLTLQVEKGDKFLVSSLNAPDEQYSGEVVGLGSRIIEIPSRLRNLPDFKSYGREVIVEIDMNNSFLQKEKVSLSILAPANLK